MKKISKCCNKEAILSGEKYFCSGVYGCGNWCDTYEVFENKGYGDISTVNVGNIVEADKFSKEIKLMRCHAIIMKDEHGQVIYTFDSIEKADEFYEQLTTK